MKAVAAMMILAAVTAAAPRAGFGPDPQLTSIKTITFSPTSTRGGLGDDSIPIEICVDVDLTSNDGKIIVGVREGEGELANYNQVTVVKECARFQAPKPENGKVLYSLGIDKTSDNGETLIPENLAKISFDFKGFEDGQQIACGDQLFTKTVRDPLDNNQCPEGFTLEGTKFCYEAIFEALSADGCIKPDDNVDFHYCQPGAMLTTKNNEGAESLAYTDGVLTLGKDAGAAGSDVLVVVAGDGTTLQPPVPTLEVTDDIGSVTLVSFERSTNAYTACPVEESGYSVYTIKDLYIIATNENEGDKQYYEFGLRYDGAPPKYKASTGTTNDQMIINCENLVAGAETRCYGFVEQTGDEDLIVSYYDDKDAGNIKISNKIVLATGDINQPAL